MWRLRRQEKNQEMSTAIERARQRRDEEEKRMETERRRGAEEKLKALEERTKKRTDSYKVSMLFNLLFASLQLGCILATEQTNPASKGFKKNY